MKKTVGTIPKYIMASNPKGLRRQMLRQQVRLGYGVHFFDIQFVNGKWYAWFEDGRQITSANVAEELSGNDDNTK
jgi:hypothetical protein